MSDSTTESPTQASESIDTQESVDVAAEQSDEGYVESRPQSDNRIEELQAQISQMAEQIAAIPTQLQELSKPKPQQLTPEQQQQLWQQDPNAALSNVLDQKMGKLKNDLQIEHQRQYWDDKAKQEFPVNDPKFKAQLKKEWEELRNDGLDPNSPRAVYRAAKNAALVMGIKEKKSQVTNQGTVPSAEAPAAVSQTKVGSRSAIPDNDPRVQVYMMSSSKPRTKEQINDFKQKLMIKDGLVKKPGRQR